LLESGKLLADYYPCEIVCKPKVRPPPPPSAWASFQHADVAPHRPPAQAHLCVICKRDFLSHSKVSGGMLPAGVHSRPPPPTHTCRFRPACSLFAMSARTPASVRFSACGLRGGGGKEAPRTLGAAR
jgi:hypothetical protein